MTPPTEIYIQTTGTDLAANARSAIEEAGRRLLSTLRAKVALSTELDLGHDAREEAWAALVAFCVGDLRRHLAAGYEVLYTPAAGTAETRLLVRALRLQTRSLNERIEALSRADDVDTVDALAHGIEALLGAHLEVERTVLLPALAALPGTDVETLTTDWSTVRAGGHLDRPGVVDVTRIPHGQRHPRIFAHYAHLAPARPSPWSTTTTPSHCAANSRPPTPTASPGTTSNRAPSGGACASDGWQPMSDEASPMAFASEPPLARLLCDTQNLVTGRAATTGAIWKLTEGGRQLDANLIRLTPGRRVDAHAEPDLDVLLLVVAGHGTLTGPDGDQAMASGALFWLPRGSKRALAAGPDGLSYLTVHRRRPGLSIRHRPDGAPGPQQHDG